MPSRNFKTLLFLAITCNSGVAQAVIGGDTKIGGLDANCSINYRLSPTALRPFCSGTLTEPNEVTTADHCKRPGQTLIVRCGFQGIDKAKVKLRKAADGTKLYVAGLKFKETFEIIGGNTAVPGKLKDTVRVTLNKKSKITPVSIIPHAEITDHMISYFYYKNCTMSGFGLHKDSVGVLYSSPLDIPMALLEEHDRFTFEAATFPRSLVDDNLGKALVLLEKGYTFDAETDPLYILPHKIADKLPTSTVMYGDSGSGLIYQERSGQGRWVLMGVASKTRIRLTTTDSVPTFTIHNIYEHPGDAPTPVTP